MYIPAIDIIMMSRNKVLVASVFVIERCKVIRATTREPIAAARYTRILGNEPYKKEETC
jgi:nitrogen regulatory protein PII-like uncharacterized protein